MPTGSDLALGCPSIESCAEYTPRSTFGRCGFLHTLTAGTRSRPSDRLLDLVALRQQTIIRIHGAHIRLPNHIIARFDRQHNVGSRYINQTAYLAGTVIFDIRRKIHRTAHAETRRRRSQRKRNIRRTAIRHPAFLLLRRGRHFLTGNRIRIRMMNLPTHRDNPPRQGIQAKHQKRDQHHHRNTDDNATTTKYRLLLFRTLLAGFRGRLLCHDSTV